MIKAFRAAVIILCLSTVALAQSHIPIRGTKNTHLGSRVLDAVAMGGVKDTMTCDAAQNIYMPANRSYSSAHGSVVEVMADGKEFRSFSLDSVPGLVRGHIEDFELIEGGGLYVLAREVTKYSDLEVPIAFGSTYLLKYSPLGKLENRTKLNADFGAMEPTALSILKGKDVLVAGYLLSPNNTIELFVDLFSSEGALKKAIPLSNEGMRASNADTVSSMSILRPMTMKSGGLVFVLRGSTREPMYVFSESGELRGTVKLQATDVEFSSPKIYSGELVVHQDAVSAKSGNPSERGLQIFLVFDLGSGALVKQFEWRQQGELACYDEKGLTIVHQGLDYPAGNYWAIVHAQPASTVQVRQTRPSDADITLQIRWVVPCSDATDSLPLHGDEGAREYCVTPGSVVDELDIDSASSEVDIRSQADFRLTLTPEGAQKLKRATRAQEDAVLGLVIDGELVLQSRVKEPLEHEIVISGGQLDGGELNSWVARLNAKAQKRAQKKGT